MGSSVVDPHSKVSVPSISGSRSDPVYVLYMHLTELNNTTDFSNISTKIQRILIQNKNIFCANEVHCLNEIRELLL